MDCSAFVTSLLTIIALQQTASVTSRSVSVVTESSTEVHVTDGAASFPGIVNVTTDDVERHLRQNDAVIIDVRSADEVAEFGQIPSAHVLPGCTTKLTVN